MSEYDPVPYRPPQYNAQFKLWQLCALTTMVAAAAALLAPWIRSLGLTQLSLAGFSLVLTLVVYLWCHYLSVTAYARALAAVGKPLGQLPYHPFVPRWINIVLLGLLLLMSLGMVFAGIDLGSLVTEQRIFVLAEGSFITGICLATIQKLLAVRPLLIYGERGVANGYRGCAWSAVSIRRGRTRNTIALRYPMLSETLTTSADIGPLLDVKAAADQADKE